MARVLLIQPHEDMSLKNKPRRLSVPQSLIYVGTAIEDKHEVKILDRNLKEEDEELLNLIKNYKPDIVGLSSITSLMLLDLIYVGKLIKKQFPEILIVVGGVHATIEPDSVLKEPYVDFIIRGEGEEAFLEFCDVFDKNPKELKNLRNVNHNLLREFVDMDSLKFPDYSLINVSDYNHFYVSMGRGCPGNCTFCYCSRAWGKNGKPFARSYSAEKSIELFKELIEKHKVRVFSITDDNFISFKSRCLKICDYLKDKDVHFFAFGRVDFMDDEIMLALKKAGCHTLQMGVESGSQRVLDFLNKRTTVEKNIRALQLCKKYKINGDASIMIGIPTETIEEAKETLNFVKKYKPDVPNVKFFNPLPGCSLFDWCVEKGMLKKPTTLEEWALWTGNYRKIKHNLSKIPDRLLAKFVTKSWNYGFYSGKLKKFIYWMKIGEYRYAFKGIKRVFITRGYLKIPFLGVIKRKAN